jgi:dTDP-4-dehydrorhamnose reductase
VEKDPEAAHALNVAATKDLAQLCAARSTLLIYISTEYVFSGRQGESPYDASHKVEPTTLYGLLKADGEAAVLREFEKVPGSEGLGVVLRIPVLYGEAEMPSESSVNSLMDTVWKSQQIVEEQGGNAAKIKVDHWALRYPTSTEDVGRVCHDIAAKYLAEGPTNSLPRILQFTSEDKMTKYEICQTFAEIMGLSTDGLEPNTEGNDPTPGVVARPYDCRMDTKALQDLGISVHTCDFKAWWRREVRAFRK